MSMTTNAARIGNFTSSNIWALTTRDKSGKGFGRPALNYIEEVNMERKLGRSLTSESLARPLVWGNLLEPLAFSRLPIHYELTSKETLRYPGELNWSGSPDGTAYDTVFDIKCPMTLKSFCQFVDAGNITAIRADHSDGEKYYWQLVSNSIITGMNWAELIIYMPYEKDLAEIKLVAMDEPGCKWIEYAEENELPYLIEGGWYQNINIIRFEVPVADKLLLTESVRMANEMLITL